MRECITGRARVLARAATQFMERELSGSLLTFPQLSLMVGIAAADDDRIGALAQELGLDQSTMSRNLRVLETQGLVEIAAISPDLRKRSVWLTERGALLLEAAMPAWRRGQAALATSIDPRAIERMIGAAWKLQRLQSEG